MTARTFQKLLPVPAMLVLLTIPAACGGQMTEEQIQAKAPEIHARAWVADTHLDSPGSHARNPEWIAEERHDQGERGAGLWDIPRMTEGGADAVFLAVYVGQRPLSDESFTQAHTRAIELFDWIHAMTDVSPNAELALTVADAERLHREGTRAIFIGVENGFTLGLDIANVEDFYNRGARYITLSHSGDNQICASSSAPEGREDFGLTEYGIEVVKEMNRLGIMIDCSHISDQTFFDVVELSTAPVIASHSAADAINEHGRNFSDEMLLKLKENNGTIQLIPLSSFIRATPPNPERDSAMAALEEEFGDREGMSVERRQEFMTRRREIGTQFPTPPVTMDDYIKHIDHVVNLIGIDHVGFGSDFDGGGGIAGIEDISQLPNLTVELLRRGYSSRDIEKFWGGNLLRVLRDVERAAGR